MAAEGGAKPRRLHFDEIDSTNEEAKRRALAGEAGPLWISADAQSAGRGRRGRAWISARGNLFATGLYTFAASARSAAELSFAAALAVGETAEAGGVDPALISLKWPNDVLIDARKCAGILLESGRAPSGGFWLAVGIGLNLVHHPADSERPATDLAAHGAKVSVADALDLLSSRFPVWLERWQSHGFAPLRDAWLSRAHGLGEACTVRLEHETLEGVFADLGPDGAMRLDLADGTRRYISAGDVFFPARG